MDIPAPITRIIPRARPVVLGAATYLVSEFRLADLADLQAWIEAETPDPFDEAASALLGGDRGPAWKRLLWDLIDGTETYPPRAGTPEGDELIFSPAGLACQLFLSLRRERPAFALDDAARLLGTVTPDQWGKFSRVAWGQSSRSVVAGIVERAAGVGPIASGGPADWPGLWQSYVANAGAGAPPFESLTLTQFRTWLSGGDPDGRANGDREDAWDYAAKVHAFWAPVVAAPEVAAGPAEAGPLPPGRPAFPWTTGGG